MTRLGIIEDNLDYRRELVFHLKRADFEIVFEDDGRDIDRLFAASPPEILLLDLGLPDEDGLSIAHRLRSEHPELGIVILTARKTLDDRLEGLAEGADAYLAKPVDFRELVAVIRNLERRVGLAGGVSPRSWWYHRNTFQLVNPDGQEFTLTPNEAALIAALADCAPAVASRKALASALGHDELDYDYRRLELVISRLRHKIEPGGSNTRLIRAARGRGYVFTMPICVI